LPLDLKVSETARYMNLGEWLHHCTYAVYDGKELILKTFEESINTPS
jgi:UDP-2,3-diacylglucosamine hydrolase